MKGSDTISVHVCPLSTVSLVLYWHSDVLSAQCLSLHSDICLLANVVSFVIWCAGSSSPKFSILGLTASKGQG